MNYKLRTNKGFTLIELVVAVALLAMVIFFSSTIFKVSIGAHRTAGANAEIMRKLRAITDQLNADFKGLVKDAPLLIWFQQDPADTSQRYDQIMFFANGDFQSTQVPVDTGEPIRGNIARIYYGHAMVNLLNPWQQQGDYERERIFARRRHILTAATDIYTWPHADDVSGTFGDEDFAAPKGYNYNEIFEHDSLSLAVWKIIPIDVYNDPCSIIDTCFGLRPWIDMGDPNTFHKLMCDGVGSLAVQWAYWDPNDNELRWFPSDDPDGDIFTDDSHFGLMNVIPKSPYIGDDMFGGLFNIPNTDRTNYWFSAPWMQYKLGNTFPSDFCPEALKFTFTLYDSKKILEKGRTFTHIVYLDN